MRKSSIKHENLKRTMDEIETLGDEAPNELFDKLLEEIKHSCLIIAGDVISDTINIVTAKTDHGDFGLLFTDMDEFMKIFPDFNCEAHENSFTAYMDMIRESDLEGFILNPAGEGLILHKDVLNNMGDMPEYRFSSKDSYSSQELKDLKDSISNDSLEEFINNPGNIGRYEELFDEISSSTLLTLMLSRDDLNGEAENGVISMSKTGPRGFLYIDKVGGSYATVYTSEDKISSVNTPFNKYSQIVNFSQMTNFILNDDMDGIIINPNSENILLSRDVLLEYSNLLERTCNNKKLNSAIFHMFPMEG